MLRTDEILSTIQMLKKLHTHANLHSRQHFSLNISGFQLLCQVAGRAGRGTTAETTPFSTTTAWSVKVRSPSKTRAAAQANR